VEVREESMWPMYIKSVLKYTKIKLFTRLFCLFSHATINIVFTKLYEHTYSVEINARKFVRFF
jgi:hypothetical protein